MADARSWLGRCLAGVLLLLVGPGSGGATIRYGPIRIAGNLETQNLFRIGNSFDFDPVQLRNTLRLQYEHRLVERGSLLDGLAELPWIDDVDVFLYYRGVYDGIYDAEPGGRLQTQDGSRAGRFATIPGGERTDVATENVLREAFVDIDTTGPLSFRIGRQQIIWGTALNFRALDQNNALDLTWHFNQETGLLDRVGFSELRVPHWAIKTLADVGSVGPLSNVYGEAYVMPFGVRPTKIRLLPAPWSVPLRTPFRGGLVVDAAEALRLGAGEGLFLVQPCFDRTGNTAPNAEADPDFSETNTSGLCPSAGIRETTFSTGHYDRHDPAESYQVGARVGALTPQGVDFTVNYIHRRAPGLGLPTSASNKTHFSVLQGVGVLEYVELAPHTTTDPHTGITTDVLGYARVPIEFYFPYIHIFGVSANYPEDWFGSVLNLELTWMKGVPIGNADPLGNGIEKQDIFVGAFNVDRPTWIRWLNRGTTFTTIAQLNFVWNPEHEEFRTEPNGKPIRGSVGTPNSTLIPKL